MNQLKSLRAEMKKSRFKIWLRTALFFIFGSLFTHYLIRDIHNQYFSLIWAVILFLLSVLVGFQMSSLVPIKVDQDARAVTLSLDHFYLVLIWVLVIAKFVASRFLTWVTISDVIMVLILGIMFGRLGGIGVRVRQLKIKHGFVGRG